MVTHLSINKKKWGLILESLEYDEFYVPTKANRPKVESQSQSQDLYFKLIKPLVLVHLISQREEESIKISPVESSYG